MRIINEPEITNECKHCGSIIGYQSYEVTKGINPPFIEEPYYYYIICPKCKQEICVERKN